MIVTSAKASVDAAARAVARGEVVCFPTESFYGLAADITNPAAMDALAAVKQREQKPVALIAADVAQARMVVRLDEADWNTVARYWPGALTIVADATAMVPVLCKNPHGKVGVRVPNFAPAQALARAVGHPITATSANLSGMLPCVTIAAVRGQLGDAVTYWDGGMLSGGAPSTVATLERGSFHVLREGAVTLP